MFFIFYINIISVIDKTIMNKEINEKKKSALHVLTINKGFSIDVKFWQPVFFSIATTFRLEILWPNVEFNM